MSDTDFQPITPEGSEPRPDASIPVHDSEQIFQQLPPGPERRALLGEVEPAEPLTIEEAARQLRNRRGEQPSNGVNFKVDGRTTAKPQSDREAARDVTFARRLEHTGRIMQALPGVDIDTAAATAVTAEKGGHVFEYKLDDKDKAGALSHGDDPKTAQQRLSAMREERAAALHALAEQLSTPVEQQQPPAEATQLEQQQQPPSQPELPAQLDPVEQLRQQAEAEKNAYAQMRQATQVEWQLAQTAQQLDQQITNRFIGQIPGGIEVLAKGSPAEKARALEAFAKANPAGFKEFAEAKQLYDTCQANVEHCRQVTLLNQQRMTELQQAKARNEHAAWAAEQDKLVEKAIPELANPEAAPVLQRAALDTLKGAGITEQELRSLWNGEQTLNLRDHRAQAIISKAAKWDAAQAKAKSARPEPLPQVMRPGVALSKGEINAGDQSARLSRLGYLSPTDAMKEGAKLLSERRGRR